MNIISIFKVVSNILKVSKNMDVSKPIDAIERVLGNSSVSDEERASSKVVLDMLKQNPVEMKKELINVFNEYSGSLSKKHPVIGWVFGVSLVAYFLPQCFIADYIWLLEFFKTGTVSQFPISLSQIIEFLGAILGAGYLKKIIE